MLAALTELNLVKIAPAVPTPAEWLAALGPSMDRFGISTPTRAAAFLTQIAHESREFRRLVEDLDYTATRLTAVWPKRFPTLASAKPYAHQPECLANKVYANRLGNGP